MLSVVVVPYMTLGCNTLTYVGGVIPGCRVCVNIHSGMSSTHSEYLISCLVTFEKFGDELITKKIW